MIATPFASGLAAKRRTTLVSSRSSGGVSDATTTRATLPAARAARVLAGRDLVSLSVVVVGVEVLELVLVTPGAVVAVAAVVAFALVAGAVVVFGVSVFVPVDVRELVFVVTVGAGGGGTTGSSTLCERV